MRVFLFSLTMVFTVILSDCSSMLRAGSALSSDGSTKKAVAAEVDFFLNQLDSLVHNMVDDLYEVPENFHQERVLDHEHMLPADIVYLRNPSKSSKWSLLTNLVPFLNTGMLTMMVIGSPPYSGVGVPVTMAGTSLILQFGALKLMRIWRRSDNHRHVRRGCERCSVQHFREIMGTLQSWTTTNNTYLNPEKLKYLESILEQKVKERAQGFQNITYDFQWYGNSVDDEIVWRKVLRSYLEIWVAQVYLSYINQKTKNNSSIGATRLSSCYNAMKSLKSLRGGGDQGGLTVLK